MRHRVLTYGALLLSAVLLVSMAGCQKEYTQREPKATVAEEETELPVGGAMGEKTPLAGATVISAITATPQAGAQPTPGFGAAEATTQPVTPTVALATPEPAAPQPEATQEPASTQPEYVVYTVEQGDTLLAIASQYGTTVEAIVAANDLDSASTIYVGQKLKIPKAGSTSGQSSGGCSYRHTVRQGEWIWQIARVYGADPYDILRANGLTIETGRVVQPGTVLCIP